MEKKYLKLNDIDAYKTAFRLSNYVWGIITKWDSFARNTLGQQFVRAADSISANIAEGFGRYTKKDKIKFYRYSHGSIMESLDWNEKSTVRGILHPEEYRHIINELKKLRKELNQLIKFTDQRLSI